MPKPVVKGVWDKDISKNEDISENRRNNKIYMK